MRGCGCGPVCPPSSSGSPVGWLLKTLRSHNTVNHILLILDVSLVLIKVILCLKNVLCFPDFCGLNFMRLSLTVLYFVVSSTLILNFVKS